MKKLFIVVVVLLLLLGAAVGGAYLYASSNEEKLVMKANLHEVAYAENTSYVELSQKTSGSLSMYMPLFLGSQEPEQEQDSISYATLDVEKNTAEIKSDTETKNMTYEEYDKDENPISNYDTWESEINDGNYEAKDAQLDGEDVWQFTFNSDKLSEEYRSTIEAKMMEDTSGLDLGIEGVNMTNLNMEFTGKFIFDVYVGKEDYTIKKAVITATDDVVFTFDFSGATVDTMVAGYEALLPQLATLDVTKLDEETQMMVGILQSLGNVVPETTGSFTFKDLSLEYVWDKIEMKDGKDIPTNPLMLLVATMIS